MSHAEIKQNLQEAIRDFSKGTGKATDYYSVEWRKSKEKGLIVEITCMNQLNTGHLTAYLRDLGYVHSYPVSIPCEQQKTVKVSFVVAPIRKSLLSRCPTLFSPQTPERNFVLRLCFMTAAVVLVLWMIFDM